MLLGHQNLLRKLQVHVLDTTELLNMLKDMAANKETKISLELEGRGKYDGMEGCEMDGCEMEESFRKMFDSVVYTHLTPFGPPMLTVNRDPYGGMMDECSELYI